ncbi:MAG: LPS export ABC transporter periplasmic protein LptC [Azoarcus sp.]|jgi:lipopolysaccharide export system protein LptC|nr:LPS export ABC transporter periplasmic protein LptC [Azoarcus sp.]
MRSLFSHIDRFYPLVLAALLAVGSFWLERLTHIDEPAETAVRQTPDFEASQTLITGFNKEGKLRFSLVSPQLTHFPVTDTTFVEAPRLLLISEGRRMNTSARQGEVSSGGQQVVLTGDVKIDRESAPGIPPLRLLTEKVTIWPEEQRAISNAPAHLERGNDHANANRLEADNVFGVMTLSGRVKMRLSPSQKRNL